MLSIDLCREDDFFDFEHFCPINFFVFPTLLHRPILDLDLFLFLGVVDTEVDVVIRDLLMPSTKHDVNEIMIK